uniref:ribosomal protein L23 n=1 Tax=Lietzensia polymorpha TaxID=2962110 RepID=UPI00218246BB|nr:ribosomal protein L23 [Lietzensia polymorpha]UVI61231.1 ribosomal protein L23 [Lietzensia polymorpha]
MSNRKKITTEVEKIQKTQEVKWIDILKYPLATEKASNPFLKNYYTFIVDPRADKETIKDAFEYVFNVKVIKVNTLMTPKKLKRRRQFQGYLPTYKKAILKLAPEFTLDFFGMEKTSLGI